MDELVSAALSITDSTGFALDCFHTNAFFSSPDSITSLSVVDSPSLQFMVGGNNDTSAQLVSAGQLKEVLQRLPRLEALNWRSSIPPPDGLCELIATHCPRVTRFICEPQHYQLSSVRLFLPKWDAPSLPLLSGLGLTTLYLSQLTQAGSQAFASLLRSIAEVSSLEVLTIDFVWLDDALCELIAEAGKKLKRLTFGTAGTKFTDKGLSTLLEGCEALEDLSMDDVQGRLSRSAWEKLDPTNCPLLRVLRVSMSESVTHHSWTADHLASIHALPMCCLQSLSIRRKEGSPSLENGLVVYPPSNDDVMALRPAPQEFVESVKSAVELKHFECDFWSLTLSDMKGILSACVSLQTIRVCLAAPFSKLLASSFFSSLSNLQSLYVSIDPVHAPGQQPNPILPNLAGKSLPTPSDSPLLSQAPIPLSVEHNIPTPLSTPPAEDSNIPLLREVKKFVRKCPTLDHLEWYGKLGRGSWEVTRPTASAPKPSLNAITVDYNPPRLSEIEYQIMLSEQFLSKLDDRGLSLKEMIRDGHEWTGEQAELVLKTMRASRGERSPADKLPPPPSPTHRKKPLSLLVQKATDVKVIPNHPLTPPMSESTVLSESPTEYGAPLSESVYARVPRQRRPSEPSAKATVQAVKTRTRSATANSSSQNKNGGGEGRGTGGRVNGRGPVHRKSSSTSGANLTLQQQGRGRGRGRVQKV